MGEIGCVQPLLSAYLQEDLQLRICDPRLYRTGE
jgi:hypothetical protein